MGELLDAHIDEDRFIAWPTCWPRWPLCRRSVRPVPTERAMSVDALLTKLESSASESRPSVELGLGVS